MVSENTLHQVLIDGTILKYELDENESICFKLSLVDRLSPVSIRIKRLDHKSDLCFYTSFDCKEPNEK